MASIFSEDPKSISILSLGGTIIGLHMFLIVGMLGFFLPYRQPLCLFCH